MCRIFAFRSVLQGRVHQSLVGADNALMSQSCDHPDGWGVAYYVFNTPHLIRSTQSAMNDEIFKKLSSVVHSQSVVAHIRKATLGNKSILNTHPFQYGQWIFAHNGHILDLPKHQKKLRSLVDPKLQGSILGDTDSELIFYLFLTQLARLSKLAQKTMEAKDLISATRETIHLITSVVGDYSKVDDPGANHNYLSFVATDGLALVAFQGGKNLSFSTSKGRCPERDLCPEFAPVCETKAQNNQNIKHLIISSDALKGENVWQPMQPGQMVGVDSSMNFFTHQL